ncbi:MAG TPA: ribonucleotide-diphosphate reductase subunit beta [Ktedonobacteraceae bacterium]|nr:ribonucleotide-diphosphate reductase subunit beta [Ktedonobacteraceae bacterium]
MTTEASEQNGFIDIDSETSTPVERDRLYRLWEENNWSAKDLDFSRDAQDWQKRHTEQQQRAILWNCAMFLDGEESVTVTLAPFLNAAPRYEDRIYLATQIADEARHHVFFDRFLREVCHIGQDYRSTLSVTHPYLPWGYKQVFTELDRVSDRLRLKPDSLPLLAQGVAIYHLVVEGMLAHTGQHYLRDYASRTGLFPGFKEGINMVARDESRHIAFGMQLLRELVTSDAACRAAAIEMLDLVLPWAAGVFMPPACDWNYVTCLGYSPQEVFAFGLRSIETKLRRAGIEPSEVKALVKIGYADSPMEQADRLVSMIEGHIIGTDEEPCVNEKSMDALFASVANVADWTRARHPRTPCTIQWVFDEAEPRYLELRPGETPQVGTGKCAQARLTLYCSAADWIRIVTGQLKQQRALFTRRLRPSGDIKLLLRLPHILPA